MVTGAGSTNQRPFPGAAADLGVGRGRRFLSASGRDLVRISALRVFASDNKR